MQLETTSIKLFTYSQSDADEIKQQLPRRHSRTLRNNRSIR